MLSYMGEILGGLLNFHFGIDVRTDGSLKKG